jgi:hypothetical protein
MQLSDQRSTSGGACDRDRDLNDLDPFDLFLNNIMAAPTEQTAPPTAPPATKTQQQILAYEMLKLVTGELVKDSDIAKTAEGDPVDGGLLAHNSSSKGT